MWFKHSANPDYYGYYQVGNKKFYNKIQALMEATKTSLDPKWIYFPEIFDKLDWKKSLNINIKYLYMLRAKQLREKYDYLVLHYSGGADSHTILETFINNNIKLDEVYVRWPVEYTESKWKASNSDDPKNFLSEWELTIKPALEKLRTTHANIKITINDITNNFKVHLNGLNDDMFVYSHGGVYMGIGSFTKMTSVINSELDYLTKSKVGNITGVDKPLLINSNNKVLFSISDMSVGSTRDHSFENIEHFYITPDMPELCREQSHLIMNHFSTRKQLQELIKPQSIKSAKNRNIYFEIVKSIIYPDWDWSKFQATKRDNTTYNAMDHFLFQEYENDRMIQKWESILNSTKQSIHQKYWSYDDEGRFSNYIPFKTPFYQIGEFNL